MSLDTPENRKLIDEMIIADLEKDFHLNRQEWERSHQFRVALDRMRLYKRRIRPGLMGWLGSRLADLSEWCFDRSW